MRTSFSNNPEGLHKEHKQVTENRLNQLEKTEKAFADRPATMLMIAHKTGIERANICRYVATLQKSGKIALLRKRSCQVTGAKAGYYTTDPNLFPKEQQLNLF